MANGGTRRWRMPAVLLATGLIVGALLWQDRGSPERGNRLYRAGDVPAALRIYRARATTPAPPATASYNLGTALLAFDPDDAERHLGLAVQGVDSVAAQRGYYNLGYLFLASVDPSTKPDSAIPRLIAAVRSNRAALRLNVKDESARWNLALAQHMLDAFGPRTAGPADSKETSGTRDSRSTQQEPRSNFEARAEARGSSGESEGGAEREAQNLQPGDAAGQRASIPGGESEAWAGNDPGPLTEAAALRLIKGITDSPEQLVRGLLWSHRPKVAWWNAQPFPGGNW